MEPIIEAPIIEGRYIEHFREILEFDEKSDLLSLIYQKASSGESSAVPSGRFSWLMKGVTAVLPKGNASQAFSTKEQKLLLKKLKSWSEFLLDELDKQRYDKNGLEKLQVLAEALFGNKKTAWIKMKIDQLKVDNPKLSDALALFEKRMISILTAPKIIMENEDESISPPIQGPLGYHNLLTGAIAFQYGVPSIITRVPFLSKPKQVIRPADAQYLQKQREERRQQLEMEKSLARFSFMLPEHNEREWDSQLISAFSSLDRPEEIRHLGKSLDPIQTLELFERSCDDENRELQKKFPLLLISLKFHTLNTILPSLTNEQVQKLNQILRKSREGSEHSYLELFGPLRQEFAEECNRSGQAIDQLNRDLRIRVQKDGYLNSLCELQSDFARIADLRRAITFDMENFEKFFILIDHVFNDTVTKDLKPQIQNNYKMHLARLVEDPDEESIKENSYPYGIIIRSIFNDNDCDDEDSPMEIFGGWNLHYPSDYHKVGLYGDMPEKKRIELTEENKTKGGFYAAYNLHRLGINSIKDWKNLKIYNSAMLMQFLAEDKIRAKIHNNIPELIDVLIGWGIIFYDEYRAIGLLRGGTNEELAFCQYNHADREKFAIQYLNMQGIFAAADLKRLEIHNAEQLGNFLRSKIPNG